MQRPTNNQVGILGVCAVGAFVVFLVYHMLLGGRGFIASLVFALILALIVAALIYLFIMTAHGRQMVGEASTRLSAAAVEAKAKIEEKAAEAKAKMDERVASAKDESEASAASAASATPDPEPIRVPATATEPASAAAAADSKPAGLDSPRAGGADDLKKIKGIGPKLEQVLNGMGYYHFDQIAAWGAAEVAWVDENLEGFRGRVTRDNWVEQAGTLAGGGSTEFSKKVDDGNVY